MNILLVEDNVSIIKGLVYYAEKNNLHLTSITNIKEAKEYLKTHSDIALIILDITLPDGNGLHLYEEVIKNLNIPTIFLTALDEEDTIVKCLDNGAEDYITKPFSAKELLARVNKVFRHKEKKVLIKVKDITFNIDKAVLFKGDKEIDLTPIELNLVNLLFNNLGSVVSRNVILDKIWECTGNYVDDHTVTVYFKRLREKLGTDVIKTVKGMGYRIDEE